MNWRALLLTVYAGIIAGFIISSFYSCNKADLFNLSESDIFLGSTPGNTESLLIGTGNALSKTVGAPLEGKTGRHWIRNYRQLESGGRVDYFLMIRDLEEIWKAPGCVGICLYYAVTNQNELIILPVGINEMGAMMQAKTIDTENGQIDWITAKQWMLKHKGFVQAHFFGKNTFERLTKDPDCRILRASYAIDDEGNVELLLADAADSDPWLYEAKSLRCPPQFLLAD